MAGMENRDVGPVCKLGTCDRESNQLAPELPAWKAFVVQFSSDTGAAPGTFSGRVEHLNSGRRAHFATAEELLTVLEKLLRESHADLSGARS